MPVVPRHWEVLWWNVDDWVHMVGHPPEAIAEAIIEGARKVLLTRAGLAKREGLGDVPALVCQVHRRNGGDPTAHGMPRHPNPGGGAAHVLKLTDDALPEALPLIEETGVHVAVFATPRRGQRHGRLVELRVAEHRHIRLRPHEAHDALLLPHCNKGLGGAPLADAGVTDPWDALHSARPVLDVVLRTVGRPGKLRERFSPGADVARCSREKLAPVQDAEAEGRPERGHGAEDQQAGARCTGGQEPATASPDSAVACIPIGGGTPPEAVPAAPVKVGVPSDV
mmetsp:Transcript_71253/g.212529  ORF Transcript_71253/g.212529 Transcript_71253/m.212529 type:complete len:282 (+) Transcript_71253:303-1148(+)